MNRRVTRSLTKKLPEQDPRRSTRIAALASKASSSKKKISHPASKLSLGAGTKPKKPVIQRQPRSGQRPKLSSSALQHLNRETINEPLPNALRHWRQSSRPPLVSEDLPSTPSSKMSTYDKNLPEQLTRRGIFDETLPPDPAKPKNLLAIQDDLLALPPSSDTIPPSEEEISDYSVYCQIITSVGILENDMAARAFQPFFDVPLQLPDPHVRGGKQQWGETTKPQIHQRPKPDYFEGLDSVQVPEWVVKHLGNYARPVAGIAFPNFLVEHKSEGSMKVAHTQCRLDGALAARGYYELYGLFGDPSVVLNTALVGTVEFNGESFVGNVHWVSQPSSGGKELEYHMRRVMCFFARGRKVEDFLIARQAARNFRAYFSVLRTEHLTKLRSLKDRPHPPNYARLKVAALVEELTKRKLSTKGVKGELVTRLEKDDAAKSAQALEGLIETVGQSHIHSQNSNPSRSFEGQESIDLTQSSQKRARGTEDTDRTPGRKRVRADSFGEGPS